MSGDWIKMTVGLRTHPKVVRLASALKADRLRVIGGLFAVWGVFDQHSTDGVLEGYTLDAIDEDLGWRGFAAAMNRIGWLDVSPDGLSVPEFDEHNSKSAKRRASDTKRKANDRAEDKSEHGSWNDDGQLSASEADKLGTREELEKSNTPPTPPRGFGRKAGNTKTEQPPMAGAPGVDATAEYLHSQAQHRAEAPPPEVAAKLALLRGAA